MSVEIRVPQLPESVADATLVAWRKQPGQAVSRDENLADLETDKVVLEVPAPISGVLREIKVQGGASVKSGELLAVIDEAAAASASAAAPAPAPAPSAAAGNGNAAVTAAAAPGAGAASSRAGPAARRVIEQNNLAPGSIAGSAPGGRVTKNDALAAAAAAAQVPASTKPAVAAPAVAAPAIARSGRTEQRVPMTRLRARIAERLIQAQSTQALLTTFNEVDLTTVQELRARYKDSFEKKHGVKLGFMSFFVKASIEALKRFPVVNAAVENNDIIYHEYFDIGVAVSTERGLMVPVLRDADAMSFADVESGIADYAARARDRIDHARGSDRRHLQHHQRRHFRLADVDPDRQRAAKRDPRHAQDSAATDGGEWPGRDPADDVPGGDLRSSHHRRTRGSTVSCYDQGLPRGPGPSAARSLTIMAEAIDVVVIGAGPAGYPAAIRAAQNGLKVICVDAWRNRDGASALGGTCLNAGCIPSKALLESSELLYRAQNEFAAHGIVATGVALDLARNAKAPCQHRAQHDRRHRIAVQGSGCHRGLRSRPPAAWPAGGSDRVRWFQERD